MPELLTAMTSRSPSCWPWSTSRGSTPVIRRPALSMVMPGLEQHPPVGPVHHLGPEDRRRARLGRTAQQLLQGVRGGLAVVVQQPDPLGPLARRQPGRPGDVGVGRPVPQRVRDGRAVAGPAVHAEHHRAAQQLGEHRPAAVPAAGVHGHDPLHRPGLAEQRLGDTRQPRGAVVSDDHRGNDVLALRVSCRHESACWSEWSPAGAPPAVRSRSQPGRVRVNNTRPDTGRAGTLDASVQSAAGRAAVAAWTAGQLRCTAIQAVNGR